MSLNFSLSQEIEPVRDFYRYVNDDWIKKNKIPPDFQRWSVFNQLNEDNRDKVKALLDGLSYTGNNELNSLKTLYDQGLKDLENINSLSPGDQAKNYINSYLNCETKEELLDVIFRIQVLHGFNTPFSFSVYSDLADSSKKILHIFTRGLGLPDRDYYFQDDKEEIRIKYKQFMKRYCKVFNLPHFNTEQIYNFEKSIAEVTMTKVEKRNPENLNNPKTYQEVFSAYKSIPTVKLFEYFKERGYDIKPGKINLSNPKLLSKYEEIWNTCSLDCLKQYYIWRFINSISSFVNEVASEEKFQFYGKVLTGTPEQLPRWKRIIGNCNNNLGEVVGKLFVREHFPESSKKKAENMVKYIKDELASRLKNNDWMESKTKEKALEKLEKMRVKIGYSDNPDDYSKLVLRLKDSYLDNNLKCFKFNEDLDWVKLYKPKDLDEWFMNPHMVNAYYSPSNNEIVFPAGILQAPFFCKDYDIALNFGGIGCVIGHEITHGFDDQGRKFDADGNLNDWWTDTDEAKYKAKTKRLRDQFAGYKIEGEFLNGDLTLGENIADLGGVSISYYSLVRYLKDNEDENKVIDGFTPYQRFFLNYAKIWRSNTRTKETLRRLVTDPHSPSEFRVNGVLVNLKEFYKAFGVKQGDNLWKPEEQRISIW
jgi:putative endopeptidase